MPGAAPRWRGSWRSPPAPLELREKLEQLRALEAGMRIVCARVAAATFGVDTPEDLARARAQLAAEHNMTERIDRLSGPPRRLFRPRLPHHPSGRRTLPCDTFEATIEAVREGAADLAMLPCENSLAGRVPDIHALLPESGLFVVGEHFLRVEHCLLAPPSATLATLRRAHSHAVALGQVRRLLRELHLTPVVEADTAGAAEMVAARGDPADAAIASSLAAELFGLKVLRRNVEDAAHNTTRFYVAARTPLASARTRRAR